MIINEVFNKSNSNCLDSALDYASRGFRILPTHGLINGYCTCGKPKIEGKHQCKAGKHPSTRHGVDDATTLQVHINEWWNEAYWRNVAIATGGHIFVFEIDPRHGGDKTLERLVAEHGPLPVSPLVKSGGGGHHYYFRYPDDCTIRSRSGVAEGIDVRGDKGYVVAPPSLHESGNHYEWVVGLDKPIADAPAWVLAIVTAKAQSPSQVQGDGFTLVMGSDEPVDFASHPGAKEGKVNDEFMRLIGVHLSRGDSPQTIRTLALAWAQRCEPIIPEREVQSRLRWAESKRREPDEALCGVNSFPEFVPDALAEPEQVQVPSLPNPPYPIQPKHEPEQQPEPWPVLHADALHGLAGAIVRAIDSETEADMAGVLLTILVAFGNAISSRPHYAMASGTHRANLFVTLVGDTASAKGQAQEVVKQLFDLVDPTWVREANAYGLSSGEGLVDRVKDEHDSISMEGGVFRMPSSKRLLCIETEFVKPIVAMRREGNTLSAMLRNAWDGQTLEVNTRGKSKLRASNAHISIIAHITPHELSKVLGNSVEIVNGFSNRFLWAMVKRSKSLPDGGDPSVLDAFVEPMQRALEKARTIERVFRDAIAKALWFEHYEALSSARPGAYGPTVSRGHAQTLRLSFVYALLDGSDTIRVEHLRAALAVWAYCEDSARLIFGKAEGVSAKAEPEPLDMVLLNLIIREPGIKRKRLHEATGNRVKAEDMDSALASLESRGLAHHGLCKPEHGGRPAECWYPGGTEPDDDGATPEPELVMSDVVHGTDATPEQGLDSQRGLSVGDGTPCSANLANELINSGDTEPEPELVSSQSLFAGALPEPEPELVSSQSLFADAPKGIMPFGTELLRSAVNAEASTTPPEPEAQSFSEADIRRGASRAIDKAYRLDAREKRMTTPKFEPEPASPNPNPPYAIQPEQQPKDDKPEPIASGSDGKALSEDEFLALLKAATEPEPWQGLGVAERMEREQGLDGMPSFWREQLIEHRALGR